MSAKNPGSGTSRVTAYLSCDGCGVSVEPSMRLSEHGTECPVAAPERATAKAMARAWCRENLRPKGKESGDMIAAYLAGWRHPKNQKSGILEARPMSGNALDRAVERLENTGVLGLGDADIRAAARQVLEELLSLAGPCPGIKNRCSGGIMPATNCGVCAPELLAVAKIARAIVSGDTEWISRSKADEAEARVRRETWGAALGIHMKERHTGGLVPIPGGCGECDELLSRAEEG